MTRNEKIAEVMGWELVDYLDPSLGKHWANKNGEYICDHLQFRTYLPHAKLLQAKMVADGYQFYFSQDNEHGTTATAFVLIDGKEWDEISVHLETYSPNDEPAAIFELFCKVFNIEGEG